MAIEAERLGPAHPVVGQAHNNYAVTLMDQGSWEASEEHVARATAILTAVYGPDHPRVALVTANLGRLRNAQGRSTDAEAAYRKALSVLASNHGEDHQVVSIVRSNLGNALKGQGKLTEARTLYTDALRRLRATAGPSHPVEVKIHNELGRLGLLQEDYAAAREALRVALDVAEVTLPPDADDVAAAELIVGQIAEREGNRDEALEHYGRSMDIYEGTQGPRIDFAEPAFAIARLRVHADRAEAIALARRASEAVEHDQLGAKLRAEIDHWLTEHDPDGR
jgi:tetratricopeptide (TPR) repeat protein